MIIQFNEITEIEDMIKVLLEAKKKGFIRFSSQKAYGDLIGNPRFNQRMERPLRITFYN